MYCTIGAVTHTGNVRKRNEDHILLDGRISGDEKSNGKLIARRLSLHKPHLIAVFDGMGGISAGDTASLLAAQTAAAKKPREAEAQDVLREICTDANAAICDEMTKLQKRIGSTASMLILEGEQYHLCNIGDSPIYLFRDRQLSRISEEHTERAAYEREHGPTDPRRKFRLTQYLGIFPHEATLVPRLSTDRLMAGDRLLLCSDGLSDYLTGEELSAALGSEKSDAVLAEELLQTALSRGGKDNVSVICIRIRESTGLLGLFESFASGKA